MRTLPLAALLILTLSSGGLAAATLDNPWRVKFGPVLVAPSEDSSSVGDIPGTRVGIDNEYQPGLTISYLFSPNWAIELLGALPFEHNISGEGTLRDLDIDSVGEIKHLPPSLLLQYRHPMQHVTPYVGAGVNYTLVFDEQSSRDINRVLGETELELDDSWGWAAQIGVDVEITPRWLLNAAIWYLDIDTTASLNTPNGRLDVDVEIDPWVYMLGVGLKF